MTEQELAKYQVDHLILLVGGNPLSNAVAGRILLKDCGRITLLHTVDTRSIADRLKIWFTQQGMAENKIDVRGTDPTHRRAIQSAVEQIVTKGEAGVGLNYTSGTSAMSVHVHTAVSQRASNPICSYLDGRSLCMIFDDGATVHVGRPEQFEITIEELFWLHNTPLREQKNGSTSHNTVPPDIEGEQKGDRFEKEVGRAMLSLLENGQIDEMWMNVKAELSKLDEDKWPEFDVVALRGYQLFFVSCATTSERSKLKQKLFEAYVRGRQLGGDEACVALACQKQDPSLELEIQQTLQVKDRVKVFGGKHLPKLPQHLSIWIKEQSREGKPCPETNYS